MKDGQKFCAVVKADCYGLGAQRICPEIDGLVDYFAVSSEDEFMEINNIVTKPILLLDPIYENITKLSKLNCEFCISNMTQFKLFYCLAKKDKNVNLRLHLAINTGMNRFGFCKVEEICEIINLIKKAQNISIIGIFSHFYTGNNGKFVKNQVRLFNKIKNYILNNMKINNIVFHISNTDGFENCKDFDMVRIGIGMYLFNNNDCFSMESKIVEIRMIKKGENVGYGNVFFAPKNMQIAVVLIGYADGILRKISGRGFVLVNGNFCKVLAVCMDSIIIDVSHVRVYLNDDVVLIGRSDDKQIFCCDFAEWCGTISYEIMTRISSRVKRIYLGGKANANYNWKVSSKKTSSG